VRVRAGTLALQSGEAYSPPMNVLAKPRMNVDEFLDWAVGRPGRFELFRGEVWMMSPETVGHAKIKAAVHAALSAAARRSGKTCHVLPDGVIVRVDKSTAYEPDAQVYCGEALPPTALEVPKPVIIVEVLSQSTRRVDVTHKLAGYFAEIYQST
jgi:Uma2 family endonuclease